MNYMSITHKELIDNVKEVYVVKKIIDNIKNISFKELIDGIKEKHLIKEILNNVKKSQLMDKYDKLIEKYGHLQNFFIYENKEIDEDFIKLYKNEVNWVLIDEFIPLSDDFRKEFAGYLIFKIENIYSC
jgi:hypothetical protein